MAEPSSSSTAPPLPVSPEAQELARRRFQDPLETWSAKFKRKFEENPWVPIGCAATCAALVMSAVKMRQGQSKQMNHWLRARVGLQFLTVGALLAGSSAFLEGLNLKAPSTTPVVAAPPQQTMESSAKEKAEFAERLKEAERTTEMETGAGFAVGLKTVKGPQVVDNASKKQQQGQAWDQQQQAKVQAEQGQQEAEGSKGKSWFWWRN